MLAGGVHSVQNNCQNAVAQYRTDISVDRQISAVFMNVPDFYELLVTLKFTYLILSVLAIHSFLIYVLYFYMLSDSRRQVVEQIRPCM